MQEAERILINENERKPNLYAAKVMTSIVVVLVIIWALNEAGIFQVEKVLMSASLTLCLIISVFMQITSRVGSLIDKPATKYVYMASVLIVIFVLSFLLNINAVLGYVLPILLASQYRSRRISLIALFGSFACCVFSPMISYALNTYSILYMTGFIETFCGVTIAIEPNSLFETWQALGRIMLFWSLPQALTILAYGVILFSITRNGIIGVNDHIQVVGLTTDLNRQYENMIIMQEKVIFSLSDIIENRDTETGGHVKRTSEVVRMLAYAMRDDPNARVSTAFCENVVKCAPMHDLGKIAIPDTILKKAGKLTDVEYAIVKLHPIKSAEIIERALTGVEDDVLVSMAVNIAKYHHERMDGKGYPSGLIGDEIPIEARIMAIADVYDALVSERCYKAPMSFDDAFKTIMEAMGTQFDPMLVKYFVACRNEVESFYLASNG